MFELQAQRIWSRTWRAGCVALVCSLGASLVPVSARANPVRPEDVKTRIEARPQRLDGVQIVERLGAQVPTQLRFEDSRGHQAPLADFLDPNLPTILTLNYADCPMLCSLELTGLVTALADVEWSLGKDFRIVTVSLDPDETQARAVETKARYLRQYERAVDEGAWAFLRGSGEDVRALADAVGFGYTYNEARDEYLHPAVMAILAPDGRVVRYLYGIEYQPKTLALSLVEASEGKIGTAFERVLLYCFHYDETEGRYAPVAMNIMRLGGLLVGCVVVLGLAGFWIRERRRKTTPETHGSKAHLPSRGSVS